MKLKKEVFEKLIALSELEDITDGHELQKNLEEINSILSEEYPYEYKDLILNWYKYGR